MHIWTNLLAREFALLAILPLLGACPASLLSDRFDAASRIAMSALLGFCVGTCVTTTILQFAPTDDTYWILVPLALASVSIAALRTRRVRGAPEWRRRLPPRDLAALALVGLAVAGPVTYTLHERATVGPAVYYYSDADNYVAIQDAARTTSLHAARQAWDQHLRTGARWGDLTQLIWSSIAGLGSNLDAGPLDSNVNALLGLWATDTYSPFLTVLLLTGALGAFAAVRYFSRSRTWTAVLGGSLFGGPMFLELWYDSFQAAIVAVGLLLPFLILCDDALRNHRRATLPLIALIVATMLTVYPLYIPFLLGTSALLLLWNAWTVKRRGRPLRPLLRPVGAAVLAVVLLAIAFDPVGFIRDFRYYETVLNGTLALPRVTFHLPLSVLPGWIAQTREFWNMPPLGTGGVKQLLLGALFPLLFLGLVVIGLRRYRASLVLVAMSGLCAVVAEYSFASRQACTYCAERNLLPLTPLAAVLIALGLCALLACSDQRPKVVGMLGVALVVLAVGQRTRVELTRFANASYFTDSADRSLLTHVAMDKASIEEEGFGASVAAESEQPLVYHLINERAPGAVSVILGSDVGNSIAYLDLTGLPMPPGPEFHADYRYILTRLAGVATDRRVIARSGGIALEERVQRLDVTPYAGLAAPLERVSRSGVAWVQTQYPLQLYLVGYDAGRRAWARLTFTATVPVAVPPQAGVHAHQAGSVLTVCVPATGRAPIRRVTVTLNADLIPGEPPDELFPPAMPLEGVALTSMYAVAGGCTT
jgi:hypothetical protein